MNAKRSVRLVALAFATCAMAAMSAPSTAWASPMLWLVKSGTPGTTADSIAPGTATYSLDLRANTDGNAVSGLQYYLQTSPSGAVRYGGTPLTMLNNPFTASDVNAQPSAGATVQSSGGTTALFKSGSGDYSAFVNNALATYQFNTGSLAPGTYTFTPVGQEMTNGSGLDTTTFASPGSFTLTVVPEPAALPAAGAGTCVLLARRRRHR